MIHFQHWFFWLFLVLYLLYLAVEFTLDYLNLRHIERNRGRIPELFEGVFSSQEYQRSIAYTRAKTHFSWVKSAFDALILWSIILSGSFYHLDAWLGRWLPVNSLWHQVAYPFFFGAAIYLLHLPFSLYYQFVLEEKFGFNKMRAGTFLLDQAKGIALSLALGIPLLAFIFWLVPTIGTHWWIMAWAALMLFQLLTAALFPVVFAPIFYKFTPLQEGDLKDKLHQLTQQLRFKMAGVFTIDGSRRSAHSNAFFAGIGKTRRIVLFDTLIQSLSIPEIVAVIAHEIGHNKKRHILKGLVLSSATTLFSLWVLQKCLEWPAFFEAFGVPQPSLQVGFVIFGLLSSVFTFPLNPIFQWLSRRNEYEADRYSIEVNGDREGMISSLVKLSKDNLSNLTPHPWYSFYHYSHPTTTERAEAIRAYQPS
ncbi:MAG: M48 family metallopeptidase [Deltaproteobacteria bacterium]|nr:M48 family metallopeptidase [Deltaproteobacteria bacterium]